MSSNQETQTTMSMQNSNQVSFNTVQYSDVRFLRSDVPDESMLQVLEIQPEYKNWVRIVDELDGCRLVHYLTPNEEYENKESVIQAVGHVRGVILDKNNKIICKSLPYTPEYVVSDDTIEDLNTQYTIHRKAGLESYDNGDITNASVRNERTFEDFEQSIAWEGTLIRLFYHEDDWYVATHRKINAYNSFVTPRSFGDMFEDVLKSKNIEKTFVDKLDKNCVFAFVMIHPMNTIIYQVKKDSYDLMLASVYNKDIEEYVDEKQFNDVFNGRISFKTSLNYDSWTSILKDFNDSKFNDVYTSGIIMTSPNKKVMFKLVSQQYANLRDVRGSNPSIGYRYLELRNDPVKRHKLEDWFADDIHRERILQQQQQFENLVSKLHRWYISRFINKIIKEMPKEEHVTLHRCHDWYKTNVKTNPQSKVTSDVVRKFLMDAPFHCLVKMLNRK